MFFVSEDRIAACLAGGRLGLMQLFNNRLVLTESAESTLCGLFHPQISITPDGSILVASGPQAYSFSADLSEKQILDIVNPVLSSRPAAVLGVSRATCWEIRSASPDLQLRRNGLGQLLDLSDNVVVYRQGNRIRVESLGGKFIGSIGVPRAEPRFRDDASACVSDARLAGQDHLLLTICGRPRIVNFAGHKVTALSKPRGTACGNQVSANGGRAVFASTRSGFLDNFLALYPQDTEARVEVEDTRTGGKIWTWIYNNSQGVGAPVAAISPSGRSVAVAMLGTVRLFQLN
jgi:hypothetical protein